MRTVIRLGVIVALAMGTVLPWTNTRAEDAQPATNEVSDKEAKGTQSDATTQVFEQDPGAGGMEPQEAIDESSGDSAHSAWVESIWNSP
jgi:hypothetical protein